MNKTLMLVLIIALIVVAFIPGIIGAVAVNGTGIMALDLFIFTLLPFVVIFFLLHFLFKYPLEGAEAGAEAEAAVAPAVEIPESEEKLEDITPAEAELVAEPAPAEVTCPECGGAVTMYDPVCPHCGVKFEEEKEEVVGEPPAEPMEAEPLVAEIEAEPEIVPELAPEEPKVSEDFGQEFSLKCPTCGGSVGIEEKVCPHCGTDFEEKVEQLTDDITTEEELDLALGIAPEEKIPEDIPEKIEEPKPAAPTPPTAPQTTEEITLTYDEEPVEEAPAPKKKGKKKR